MAGNWQRLGEIAPAIATNQHKRVPYGMVDEYEPEGWVVVERHDTYVTMERNSIQNIKD